MKNQTSTPFEELSQIAQSNQKMTREHSLFRYLWQEVRATPFSTKLTHFITYLRRFRLIAFLLHILSSIFVILQTGALIIVSTIVFLIILPLLTALMLGILLSALLEAQKTKRVLLPKCKNKTIYVLFATTENSSFFIGNAKELASHSNSLVLVVSPFWISPKGLFQKHFYCTARKEADDLYMVRRYYFFHLKKKVLCKQSTIYVY